MPSSSWETGDADHGVPRRVNGAVPLLLNTSVRAVPSWKHPSLVPGMKPQCFGPYRGTGGVPRAENATQPDARSGEAERWP